MERDKDFQEGTDGYPAGDYRPYEGCFPGIEAGNCVMGAGLLITETGRSGCDGGVYEG